MNIITLTLNPAFDSHCSAEGLKLGCENFANVVSCEAGGKGINISRALSAYGIDSTAVVLMGHENGEQFKRALLADGVSFLAVETAGRIRENITIHSDGERETRISFCGFETDEAQLYAVEELVSDKIDDKTVLTFTGSLPNGISAKASVEFLQRMKEKGAKIVIDSRSLSLDDIRKVSPWLIKPNEEEVAQYSSVSVSDLESAAKAAKELQDCAENVMISLGGRGAVLAHGEDVFCVAAPQVEVRSTIGAGDSSIAGFIAASMNGSDPHERLIYAVAFGSADCLCDGTRPPKQEDIKKLVEIIKEKTV